MKTKIFSLFFLVVLAIAPFSGQAQTIDVSVVSAGYEPIHFNSYPATGFYNATWTKDVSTPILANQVILTITLTADVGWDGNNFAIPAGWDFRGTPTITTIQLINTSDWTTTDPLSISIPVEAVRPRSSTAASTGAQLTNYLGDWWDPNESNNRIHTSVTVASALPVKLSSFKAFEMEGNAHLSWNTVEEVNFDRFEIERSNSANDNFVKIGTVNSKSTDGKGSQYSFVDQEAPNGRTLYYRLKMINLDGTFENSRIESLRLNGAAVSVYPVPARGSVNVNSTEPIRSLELISVSGKGLGERVLSGNRNTESLSLRNVAPGLYLIKIEGVSGVSVFKKLVVAE